MMTKMVTGSRLLFPTPSVTKPLVVASGSGNNFFSIVTIANPNSLVCSPYKPNPLYKGKWFAPMIDNPAYKGEWAPRKIPNPNHFEDLTPVKSLNKIVRQTPLRVFINSPR
jgi:hypothetical protein